MRKLTFDDNGNAIDEETGKIIGRRDPSTGRLVIDQAKMKEVESTAQISSGAEAPAAESSPAAGRPSAPEKPKVSIPVPPSYTKYEVRPDSEFTVKFCLGFDGDKIDVYKEGTNLKIDGLEEHWVKFRMWNYKEELAWKSQAMEFDPAVRFFKLNQNKLTDLKLRHLIKDWSFSMKDDKFKLLHVNGVLSDESYNIMMGLHPAILDYVVALMNDVLE